MRASLDSARVTGGQQPVLASGGSAKYAKGGQVTLGRVHGHRDTGATACPGTAVRPARPVRAGAFAAARPRAVHVDVQMTGAPVRAPKPVVITGRLSKHAVVGRAA